MDDLWATADWAPPSNSASTHAAGLADINAFYSSPEAPAHISTAAIAAPSLTPDTAAHEPAQQQDEAPRAVAEPNSPLPVDASAPEYVDEFSTLMEDMDELYATEDQDTSQLAPSGSQGAATEQLGWTNIHDSGTHYEAAFAAPGVQAGADDLLLAPPAVTHSAASQRQPLHEPLRYQRHTAPLLYQQLTCTSSRDFAIKSYIQHQNQQQYLRSTSPSPPERPAYQSPYPPLEPPHPTGTLLPSLMADAANPSDRITDAPVNQAPPSAGKDTLLAEMRDEEVEGDFQAQVPPLNFGTASGAPAAPASLGVGVLRRRSNIHQLLNSSPGAAMADGQDHAAAVDSEAMEDEKWFALFDAQQLASNADSRQPDRNNVTGQQSSFTFAEADPFHLPQTQHNAETTLVSEAQDLVDIERPLQHESCGKSVIPKRERESSPPYVSPGPRTNEAKTSVPGQTKVETALNGFPLGTDMLEQRRDSLKPTGPSPEATHLSDPSFKPIDFSIGAAMLEQKQESLKAAEPSPAAASSERSSPLTDLSNGAGLLEQKHDRLEPAESSPAEELNRSHRPVVVELNVFVAVAPSSDLSSPSTDLIDGADLLEQQHGSLEPAGSAPSAAPSSDLSSISTDLSNGAGTLKQEQETLKPAEPAPAPATVPSSEHSSPLTGLSNLASSPAKSTPSLLAESTEELEDVGSVKKTPKRRPVNRSLGKRELAEMVREQVAAKMSPNLKTRKRKQAEENAKPNASAAVKRRRQGK